MSCPRLRVPRVLGWAAIERVRRLLRLLRVAFLRRRLSEPSPTLGDLASGALALMEEYPHWLVVPTARGWWACSRDTQTPVGLPAELYADDPAGLRAQLATEEPRRARVRRPAR